MVPGWGGAIKASAKSRASSSDSWTFRLRGWLATLRAAGRPHTRRRADLGGRGGRRSPGNRKYARPRFRSRHASLLYPDGVPTTFAQGTETFGMEMGGPRETGRNRPMGVVTPAISANSRATSVPQNVHRHESTETSPRFRAIPMPALTGWRPRKGHAPASTETAEISPPTCDA